MVVGTQWLVLMYVFLTVKHCNYSKFSVFLKIYCCGWASFGWVLLQILALLKLRVRFFYFYRSLFIINLLVFLYVLSASIMFQRRFFCHFLGISFIHYLTSWRVFLFFFQKGLFIFWDKNLKFFCDFFFSYGKPMEKGKISWEFLKGLFSEILARVMQL